jgi:hypothetical protein
VRAIEVADFRSFASAARRSRSARLTFAAAAAALALLAVVASPRSAARAETLLPQRANGVVVVDVSASISWETYARIATTLERLRSGGGNAGLVFFSDTAYQALPPGTPVAELSRFERFFRVSRATTPGLQPQPPRSPWSSSFSAGTRISTGLSLALETVREQHLQRPLVVLVSDLDDDAGDLESLTSVALAYRRLGIPINVVGLNPSPEDAQYLQRLLPQGSRMVDAALPDERDARRPGAGVPQGVVLVVAALGLALAAFLASTQRVRWRLE